MTVDTKYLAPILNKVGKKRLIQMRICTFSVPHKYLFTKSSERLMHLLSQSNACLTDCLKDGFNFLFLKSILKQSDIDINTEFTLNTVASSFLNTLLHKPKKTSSFY